MREDITGTERRDNITNIIIIKFLSQGNIHLYKHSQSNSLLTHSSEISYYFKYP